MKHPPSIEGDKIIAKLHTAKEDGSMDAISDYL
jgi:hypothetical protein